MNDSITKLQEMIDCSNNIVFFGGAGVSTESGIPDFRSTDGLYNQKYKYPPEHILSHGFFMSNTKDFFDFYREKMLIQNIKPNAAHIKLAELEKVGKLKAVVTQNIDGLHTAAGSKVVYELHGSVLRNSCMKCRKKYTETFIYESKDVPYCDCGGIVKPDVVLYGENLDSETMSSSIDAIRSADMLIIGGTSLSVYPAAGLVSYYSGDRLVLINRTSTPEDKYANLVMHSSIGEVLSKVTV